MDTLVQGYGSSMNGFDYKHHSIPANGCKLNHNFPDPSFNLTVPDPAEDSQSPAASGTSSEGDSPNGADHTDACLKYISQMLMEEEDLEHKTCMFQDCSALQAAEKSYSDLLGNNDPPLRNSRIFFPNQETPDVDFTKTYIDNFIDSNWIHNQVELYPSSDQFSGSSNEFLDSRDGSMESLVSSFQVSNFKPEITQFIPDQNCSNLEVEEDGRDKSPNGYSRGKKNPNREEINYGRSNKQLATNYADNPEEEESQMFDEVLLCATMNAQSQGKWESCNFPESEKDAATKKLQPRNSRGSNVGRPKGKKQQGNKKEVVDLRTLLTQCAQAVASTDVRTAGDLLRRIRQHATPHGDGTERLAYYFANALEARLAGNGMPLYTGNVLTMTRISAAQILKAYQMYVSACPFKKMSFFYANRSIAKLAKDATRLHIIDFGILYGFQWPCLIQLLSLRPNGPPMLKITGIDLPQPGFRPAERVEDTCRRLANYCERFKVPFEYNAIAKKWHEIKREDLNIEEDELLVVNSLYRLKNIPDDTVSSTSPRDIVLKLIREVNPNLFIHGVVNGTFNAPFFVTRFREALFHFSALFDMFDASVPREDLSRALFEKEVFGRDAMNVIACEGTQRVERPETYKQWQARTLRAGFRPLALDGDIAKQMRSKVKGHYHKDFVVDEDSNWLLQGWKGRIIHALSCWKPVQD